MRGQKDCITMMNTALPISRHKDYILLKLPLSMDAVTCKSFDESVGELSGGHVIINCGNHTFIPKDWLRLLLKIHLNAKAEGKLMKLVQVNPVLFNFLKREGVDSILSISKDLNDALSELGCGKKTTMDTEFIDPFLTAAIHVLRVQANVEARAGKLSLKKNGDNISGDISGIIGIVSESFNGSVVITFPEETFLKVMSNMLGENFTEVTKDIIDGAGELTNIIFGQAKITLNDKGYGIKTAIPSVIAGKNHSLSAQTKGPVVVVPFESSAGKFFVEICLS